MPEPLTRGEIRRLLRQAGDALVAAPDPRRFDELDTLEEAYAAWLTTHRNPAIRRLNEVLSAPAPPPSPPAVDDHQEARNSEPAARDGLAGVARGGELR